MSRLGARPQSSERPNGRGTREHRLIRRQARFETPCSTTVAVRRSGLASFSISRDLASCSPGSGCSVRSSGSSEEAGGDLGSGESTVERRLSCYTRNTGTVGVSRVTIRPHGPLGLLLVLALGLDVGVIGVGTLTVPIGASPPAALLTPPASVDSLPAISPESREPAQSADLSDAVSLDRVFVACEWAVKDDNALPPVRSTTAAPDRGPPASLS